METAKEFVKRKVGEAFRFFPAKFAPSEVFEYMEEYAKVYHEEETKVKNVSSNSCVQSSLPVSCDIYEYANSHNFNDFESWLKYKLAN